MNGADLDERLGNLSRAILGPIPATPDEVAESEARFPLEQSPTPEATLPKEEYIAAFASGSRAARLWPESPAEDQGARLLDLSSFAVVFASSYLDSRYPHFGDVERLRRRVPTMNLVLSNPVLEQTVRSLFTTAGARYPYSAEKAKAFIEGLEVGLKSGRRTNVIDDLVALGVSGEHLQAVIDVMQRAGVGRMHPTTFVSTSDAVIDFLQDGRRLYAKIGRNHEMLAREHAFYEIAWRTPYLRPITPHSLEHLADKKWSVLLEYDVRQQSTLVARADVQHFEALLAQGMERLAGDLGQSRRSVRTPETLRVFHEALLHYSFMREADNPVFAPRDWQPVHTKGYIEEKLRGLPGREAKAVVPLLRTFEGLVGFAEEDYATGWTVVDYDCRKGDEVEGIKVDRGRVAKGHPAAALGAMWPEDIKLCSQAYVSFMHLLREGNILDAAKLEEGIRRYAFLWGVRAACVEDPAVRRRGLEAAREQLPCLRRYAR